MSASLNAIAWFSMIGLPNATRSLAYSSEYSYAARAMPSACAPTSGRLASNVLIAACTRSSSALACACEPRVELLLAAEQAVAGDAHVVEHDLGGVAGPDAHLLELLAHREAGRARRDDERRVAAALSSGSTEATTTCTVGTCVMPPFVIHVLVPFSTHSSFASS